MSSPTEKIVSTNSQSESEGRRACRRRGTALRGMFAGVVVGLLMGGIVFPYAFADGPSRSMGKWLHHGPPQSVEEARERAETMASRLASRVNATDEQLLQIQTAAAAASAVMWDTHERGRVLRERLAAALMADTIDRDEVEAIRLDLVQMVDDTSAKLAAELLKTADVLTPNQRGIAIQPFLHGMRP